ncbi:MAG: hypothetical protein MI723_18300, partial [Caulobacterales bacterium]|nr:hypothetical protein [Caulobacterales bacterium]
MTVARAAHTDLNAAGGRLGWREAAVSAGAGLAVLLALAGWLVGGAGDRLDTDVRERVAVMHAAALADVAGAGLAAGAPETALSGAMSAYLAAVERPGDRFRAVRLEDRRLLASTFPVDADEGAPPRRLAIPEKDLFDVGLAMAANRRGNVEEGAPRLAEILAGADARASGAAVPFEHVGPISGYAELRRAEPKARAGLSFGAAALAALIAAAGAGAMVRLPRGGRYAGLAAVALAGLAIATMSARDHERGVIAAA